MTVRLKSNGWLLILCAAVFAVVFLLSSQLLWQAPASQISLVQPTPAEAVKNDTPLQMVSSEAETVIFSADFDGAMGTGSVKIDAALDQQNVMVEPDGVDFSGADVTTIKIRLRANSDGEARLLWSVDGQNFPETQSIPFEVSTAWQVVNLDMSSHWTDATIRGLRLEIASSGVEMDFIHGINGAILVIPACDCKGQNAEPITPEP